MNDRFVIDALQVQQVLARYVRTADRRDGEAMARLFVPDGQMELLYNNSGREEALGTLNGRGAIAHAVTHMMKPHPPRGWSHHTTHDPLIEVDGDQALIEAPFIVFNTVGAERPSGGWPTGSFGLQGTVTPIESGTYRAGLHRHAGQWLIETLRITVDMPMAMPKAE